MYNYDSAYAHAQTSRDFMATMEFVCEICDCSFPCNSKLERHYKSKSHITFLESLSLPVSTVEHRGPAETMQTADDSSSPVDTATRTHTQDYSEVRK